MGIDFADGMAVPDVNPPFGSMGEPPASDAERQGAYDPVTVLLNLMLSQPQGERPCEGRLPVFDGKARYDLRFEAGSTERVATRGYRGNALHCRAYLEPVSGYDEGKRPTPEDIARPIHIWLANMEGHRCPCASAPAPASAISTSWRAASMPARWCNNAACSAALRPAPY